MGRAKAHRQSVPSRRGKISPPRNREEFHWLGEAYLVVWTPDERLTFDIAFALKKVTIPGFRKGLKEEDRMAIAQTILEHLKLCGWQFSKPTEPVR
jgi:hypothetical protein